MIRFFATFAVLMALLAWSASMGFTGGDERSDLDKLKDDNPDVRMKAALALAKANKVEAFPVLIDLVAVLPAAKRAQVEEVLQDWAGDWAPVGGLAGEDEIARRIRRDGWAAWWANTDGPAILAMLKKRSLSPADEDKAKDSIRQLGDKDAALREKAVIDLIARGRVILPLLREAAKSKEAEVAKRAQRCIQRIEDGLPSKLPSSALRLLGLRKPPGAAEFVLAYLPFAEEDNVADAHTALALLAVRDGKPEPVLVEALADKKPFLRAAAAEALAGAGADIRPAVRKLLDDPEVSVRMRAGMALAPHDDKAVAHLIGMIADLPGEQAWLVHDFLYPLAGDQAPVAPDDNAESRKKSSAAWAAWWKENSAKAELTKLAPSREQTAGFVTVSEINTGKIVELGRDHKKRWDFGGAQGPVDALVGPGNRVIIAEHHANAVTERDLKGKVIWRKQLNGNPFNVQRLPNGKTLIATNVQIIEVDRTGKEVFTLNGIQQLVNQFGQLTGGYKTRKGEYVCMTQGGRCVHFDATGKELKSFNTNRGNAWMDLLPNGRIILAQNGGNKVAEYDPDGKMTLEIDVPNVSCATGLPNGNILVACNGTGRVAEMNRKGGVVWEYTAQGPFRARGH